MDDLQAKLKTLQADKQLARGYDDYLAGDDGIDVHHKDTKDTKTDRSSLSFVSLCESLSVPHQQPADEVVGQSTGSRAVSDAAGTRTPEQRVVERPRNAEDRTRPGLCRAQRQKSRCGWPSSTPLASIRILDRSPIILVTVVDHLSGSPIGCRSGLKAESTGRGGTSTSPCHARPIHFAKPGIRAHRPRSAVEPVRRRLQNASMSRAVGRQVPC